MSAEADAFLWRYVWFIGFLITAFIASEVYIFGVIARCGNRWC